MYYFNSPGKVLTSLDFQVPRARTRSAQHFKKKKNATVLRKFDHRSEVLSGVLWKATAKQLTLTGKEEDKQVVKIDLEKRKTHKRTSQYQGIPETAPGCLEGMDGSIFNHARLFFSLCVSVWEYRPSLFSSWDTQGLHRYSNRFECLYQTFNRCF